MARESPEVMASWPPPNYINPQSKGLTLVIVELVLMAIVTVVILLRVYSRVYSRRVFGLDDLLILPATILCAALTSTTCLAALRYGLGKHMWDISRESAETTLKLSWIAELFFTWSLGLTKLSLCSFYLRLPESSNTRNGRRLVYICISVVIIWVLSFTIGIVVQCKPVKAAWIINYPGGECLDTKAGAIVHATLDIFTDLFIYILPIPIALDPKLPRRQKYLLLGLYALGGIVCTAAVIRLPYTLRSMSDSDITWHINDSYLWTIIEADLAIICASMPSLAPILAKVIPNFSRSQTRNRELSHGSITKGSSSMPFVGNLTPSAFPLAHISTTASSTAVVRGPASGAWYQHWYGGGGGGGGTAPNESEENIISNGTDILAGGITKTTAIKQSVTVEVETRTPSPKVADPLKKIEV